ncbi:MAG: DUF21 domain-containing protein [Myxococcales bacterium]|nr:MAG: DUF21 domain-containing protein [Myxococcales bacterium]
MPSSLLQRVVSDLNAHLSAIQLAITSIGVAIGWLGEPTIARLIASVLATVGVTNVALIHTLAVAVAFLLITSSPRSWSSASWHRSSWACAAPSRSRCSRPRWSMASPA